MSLYAIGSVGLAVAGAQEGGAPAAGQPSSFLTFVPFIMIFAIFYFLVIAPAKKKQREHETMIKNVKHGDKIVFSKGIRGTIVAVAEDTVQVRVADKVRIDIEKYAIDAVQSGGGKQAD